MGVIILVQGENFRPNKVEAIVDDMLSLFLAHLKRIDTHEFRSVKESVLQELTSFSNSLDDVSEKYFEAIEEEMLNINEKPYSELIKKVTQKSLHSFVKKFLVNESRRITIELYAKDLKEEEKNFRLIPSFNLNQRAYKVTTLEEIMAEKQK